MQSDRRDRERGEARVSAVYGKMARGSELPQAKLNETLVRRIRAEHAAKEELKRVLDREFSAAAFAKRYQVSVPTITKVLCYDTWRHVR